MAISIDPMTHVISVPKADLTLVQSSPEIRTLDLNAFRLWLKAWEDDEEGIPQLKTHNHNTEVTLSGLVYARIVEVLAPYTVEFEDGQYTINCTGANHNLADVRVSNQVSLIVNNAAGLISNAAIEYSSFNGVVLIDVANGFAGTLYPTGTEQRPVNNLADAMLIAEVRGFDTFLVRGNLTINSGVDYTDKIFIGSSPTKTTLTIDPAAIVTNCEFETAEVLGTLDGGATLRSCFISDLNYVDGYLELCVLGDGTITLSGINPAYILDCRSGVAGTGTPTINLGGSGSALNVRNYNGGLKLINKTGSDNISIDLNSGQLKIDGTVTVSAQDEIVVRGVGLLTNNAVNPEYVQSDGLISTQYVTEATWQVVYVDTVNGSSGTAYPLGTQGSPVDNIADAKVIAERYGMRMFKVHGDITLATDLSDYVFTADSPSCSTIDLNNQSVDGASFRECTLTGVQNGRIQAYTCQLDTITNMNGEYVECTIASDLDCKTGEWTYIWGGQATGADIFNIDMNGAAKVGITKCTIVCQVQNMTDADAIFLKHGQGITTGDASNTAGTIRVGGEAAWIDGGVGGSVIVQDDTTRATVWDVTLADHLTPGTTGKKLYDGGTGDPADIAAAVWDADKDDYNDPDTMGELQNTGGSGGGLNPAEVASAVWDALKDDYGTPGTMGWLQGLINSGIIKLPRIEPGD
jgi:hypothetical protein